VAEVRKPRIEVSDGALIPEKEEKATFTAWRISFFGALALLILLPVLSPHPYRQIIAFLPDGILATFEVTALSIAFALILGLLTGLGRISRVKIINRIATVYVEVIRGIPLLVQLFYIYYAMGKIVQVPRMVAAVTAMTICYGAYLGEIFRAGIQAIPKGQMEAALALGMSRWQAMRRIILPQTIRVVLPPVGNEFIALLKDSSLVSILAVADLLRRGREYASRTFYYFETYTVVALVYLVLTLFFSKLVGIMEERLRRRAP
jgi:polar amino acid transport system permease protein